MKTPMVLALLLSPLLAFAQINPQIGDNIVIGPRDVRVVNKISVDMTPLHDWYLKPEGERPLKHWKKLQVFQNKGEFAGRDRCVLKTEEGGFMEVLLDHIAPQAKNYLSTLAVKRANIADFRAQIEGDQADVLRRDAVTPTVAAGPSFYVDAVMAQRAKVNLDAVALKGKKDTLVRMEQELDALKARTDLATIFAMYSGQNWGGFNVWDCGAAKP